MKKIIFIFIIWTILVGSPLTQAQEDRLYNEICARGFNGYKQYLQEYGGNSKKDFFIYFYNKIRALDEEEEKYGMILACVPFWKEYQYDDVFEFDDYAKARKGKVAEILSGAVAKYKGKVKKSMEYLEPVDIKSEYTHSKIKVYTKDINLANTVNTYADSYVKIQNLTIPKKGEAGLVKTRLQKMNKNHPINKAIYDVVVDYFTQWGRYHGIKPGKTYSEKKSEFQQKHKQLKVIRTTAQSIKSFGINKKLTDIDNMTRAAKTSVEKWKVHEEIDAILTKFEKNPEAGVDDLLRTKREALNASVIPLQKELRNRLVLFDKVPERINIKTLEDFLSKRDWRKDKVVRILRSEFKNRLLSRLDKLMKTGGKSSEDVRKPVEIAERYEFFFKEKPPLANCISLLEKYYLLIKKIKANKKESYREYPQLLDFYGSNNHIITACSGVSQKWHLKKDKETVHDDFWENLLMNHFIPVLGDQGKKKEEDFIHFKENVYPVAEKYFKIPDDWKSRYELLNAYFWAVTNAAAETAALNLYKNYLLLAKKYSIPRPEKEKKPPDEKKEEKPGEKKKKTEIKPRRKKIEKPTFRSYEVPQSTPSGGVEADLDYLKEMHAVTTKMNTEQEVVDYITKEAPLRFSEVGSAEITLDKLFHWHNKWSDFKYFIFEVGALKMIGEMQGLADNPKKQNEVFEHILQRYKIKKSDPNVGGLNLTELEEIRKKYVNNTRYLKLFDTWATKQRRHTLVESELRRIDNDLNYELLTTEQAIQAHYMLGQLNELRKGSVVVPECYHYASAYLLMKAYDISKIHLVSTEWIEIGKLNEKACVFCTRVKNNDDALRKFEKKYEKTPVDINQLILECKKNLEKRYLKKEMPIIKFMEDMFEYIKTGKPVNPQLQDIYKQLMEAKTKIDFSNIKNNEVYKNLIPMEYDFIMNGFFKLISTQENDWKEKAKWCISVGGWQEHITEKMSKILEEIQKKK